jgi:hypothetical protein
VHARIGDMNANGVLASMCFPSFPHFDGKFFVDAADKELALVVLRAYNDWHVHEWAGAYPRTVHPAGVAAALGRGALCRRGPAHGEARLPRGGLLGEPDDASAAEHPQPDVEAALGGVLRRGHRPLHAHRHRGRHADDVAGDARRRQPGGDADLDPEHGLRLAVLADPAGSHGSEDRALEGGIGWIPYFLERCDFVYEHHRAWTHQDFGERRRARSSASTCSRASSTMPPGSRCVTRSASRPISWECDYPHSDSTWPSSPEHLARSLAGVPDDEVDLVTHGNAMRAFQLRSFDLLGRERCTVDALRGQATNVDVTPVSGKGGTPPNRSNEPVTMGDAFNQLAAALQG